MSQKIFIVEDHEVVREGYILFLEMDPAFEVCGAAASAEEALATVGDVAPDLLLVDISLPGMSGIEFVHALRSAGNQVPVLMVTGHDHERYRDESTQAGAQGFVMKHEGPTALANAIRRMLTSAP